MIEALRAAHGFDPEYDDGVDADTILAALRAAGFAVVPVEPTREMWTASGDALCHGRIKLKAHHDYLSETVWRAMIAAAKETGDES
jgi:hypothetical protein